MKVYTKTGDKGTTSLVGGARTEKDSVQIESYGTIDELNATIGLLVVDSGVKEIHVDNLKWIQKKLFDIGAFLASEKGSKYRTNIPLTDTSDVSKLELFIDQTQENLPELKHFVLPGSCSSSALANFARAVCRRAERRIYTLIKQENDKELEPLFIFINRLSDYLFVLSRCLTYDCGKEEVIWK